MLKTIAMVAVLTAGHAFAQSPSEEERALSRAQRNCTYAVVAALPKVPGLEIKQTRQMIEKFVPKKAPDFDTPHFQGRVEVDAMLLGRSETFVAWCDHGRWSVNRVRDLSAYP